MRPRALALFAFGGVVVASAAMGPLLAPGPGPAAAGHPAALQAASATMTFRVVGIPEAVTLQSDLYEPAIAVAPSGTLYVTGHAPLAYTERAPAFVSRDDGASWAPLGGPVPLPGPLTQGVPGTEGVIVADATGRAWMLDNGPAHDALYGWCNEGTEPCLFDLLAWDPAGGAAGCAPARPGGGADRPWLAHGHGKLVLVNHAQGVAQVGLYDPDTRAQVWNMCASSGTWAPGVPAIRDADGVFVVPHPAVAFDPLALAQDLGLPTSGPLRLLHGTHPHHLQAVTLDPEVPYRLGCFAGNWGYSGLDARGNFFVAAGADASSLLLAAGPDPAHLRTTIVPAGGDLAFLWVTGNPRGEGALLTWGTSDACGPVTFRAAHVALDAAGLPRLEHASVVAPDVPGTCGDYMGSAVGPDGRAYVVVYSSPGGCGGEPGHQPLSVHIQAGGPVLG